MDEHRVRTLKNKAIVHYGGTSHGFDHACRVAVLARRIAETDGGSKTLAEAVGYLHDVARRQEELGLIDSHAERGAEMAREILLSENVPEDELESMVAAIACHSARKGKLPQDFLGQILQDADRLDALGAIAIGRIFARAGEQKVPLHDPSLPPKRHYDGHSETALNHFFEKILKLTPETFHTPTGRSLARDRYAFTQRFVDQFLSEWGAAVPKSTVEP